MEFDYIIYEKDENIARIIMNRPEKLNALGKPMMIEIKKAFEEANEDHEVKVVIIKGAGRAFSAGHDIPEIGLDVQLGPEYAGKRPPSKLLIDRDRWLKWDFYQYIFNFPKPTIAQVHGYCIYGGWMLAAAMDVVFASEDARFLPGMVEYFSVPWDLSPRKAKEILLEHRYMTAEEALENGFVNRVFPAERLEEETMAYADRVADNYLSDPFWVRTIKMSINHMQDGMGFTSEIEAAYDNFCLMVGIGAEAIPSPDQGGFARTHVARKNFDLSKPWLVKRGLHAPDQNET